MQFRL